MTDLTAYPVSSVPAAFDRGRLYSPDMSYMQYALDDRYVYDYRPGDDFEPLPKAPSEPKAWAWWRRNVAAQPTPDFLGLRTGDTISLHHVTAEPSQATVVSTCRHHAVVRYRNPEGAREPYAQTWVNQRTAGGHWY